MIQSLSHRTPIVIYEITNESYNVLVGMGGAAGRDLDHPAGGGSRLPRPLLLQTSQKRGGNIRLVRFLGAKLL